MPFTALHGSNTVGMNRYKLDALVQAYDRRFTFQIGIKRPRKKLFVLQLIRYKRMSGFSIYVLRTSQGVHRSLRRVIDLAATLTLLNWRYAILHFLDPLWTRRCCQCALPAPISRATRCLQYGQWTHLLWYVCRSRTPWYALNRFVDGYDTVASNRTSFPIGSNGLISLNSEHPQWTGK